MSTKVILVICEIIMLLSNCLFFQHCNIKIIKFSIATYKVIDSDLPCFISFFLYCVFYSYRFYFLAHKGNSDKFCLTFCYSL